MPQFNGMMLWTNDFLAATTELSAAETGSYLLLLLACWRAPNGDLPDDNAKLAKIARCALRHWTERRETLLGFFSIVDGRWQQPRLMEERGKAIARSEKASRASQTRFEKEQSHITNSIPGISHPRHNHLKTNRTANAGDGSEQCYSDASSLSLSLTGSKQGRKKKEDTPYKSPKGDVCEPDGFAAFYAGYPRKTQGRKPVIAAYGRALAEGASVEDILDGLERYQFSPDARFQPLATTWLNQQRWQAERAPTEDELVLRKLGIDAPEPPRLPQLRLIGD